MACGTLASELALVMACRSVPGPLSAVLVTVKTVAQSDPLPADKRQEKTINLFNALSDINIANDSK
jgi:hypothetical protein